MGKRSSFERNPRDYYPTSYAAVLPLLPFLLEKTRFIEPCAGDGRLIEHLERHGHDCVYSCDIEPQAGNIEQSDALTCDLPIKAADCIITNPPWERKALHAMIDKFTQSRPAWLLIDANWMFTKQAKPCLKRCAAIVTVGRVKWIEGSSMTGKDDCAWFQFYPHECETKFYNL